MAKWSKVFIITGAELLSIIEQHRVALEVQLENLPEREEPEDSVKAALSFGGTSIRLSQTRQQVAKKIKWLEETAAEVIPEDRCPVAYLVKGGPEALKLLERITAAKVRTQTH